MPTPPFNAPSLTILRHNDLRVSAAVRVDVLDGLVQVLDHLDAALQRPVLVLHGLGERRAEGQQLVQLRPRVDLDALLLQHVAQFGEEVALHQVLVDEEGFHGVAGGRVVALGVPDDLQGLVEVGVLVDVHVADALRVAQHWDVLALGLDGAHQIAGTFAGENV